ncbi:hypothetical protein [Desulfobulbus sp.]|uniref:hypothetical protein n=1 Tax=Desulfobulbus sp. TaxID=895 RepID=UPI00286F7633|nr:hypothetical protein [Desulfobulbus sp.]
MNDRQPSSLVRGMAIGALAVALVGLLLGAVHGDGPVLSIPVPEPPVDRVLPMPPSMSPPPAPVHTGGYAGGHAGAGRYQIATWESGGVHGVFVVDTATGTTKLVYSSGKGPGGKSVNHLGKPFQQM